MGAPPGGGTHCARAQPSRRDGQSVATFGPSRPPGLPPHMHRPAGRSESAPGVHLWPQHGEPFSPSPFSPAAPPPAPALRPGAAHPTCLSPPPPVAWSPTFASGLSPVLRLAGSPGPGGAGWGANERSWRRRRVVLRQNHGRGRAAWGQGRLLAPSRPRRLCVSGKGPREHRARVGTLVDCTRTQVVAGVCPGARGCGQPVLVVPTKHRHALDLRDSSCLPDPPSALWTLVQASG